MPFYMAWQTFVYVTSQFVNELDIFLNGTAHYTGETLVYVTSPSVNELDTFLNGTAHYTWET